MTSSEPSDSVSESIQQIIRRVGQEMAPAIYHLAKDRLCQFGIMSFIINMHSLTNGKQHNDFINKSSSVTSTSKALFPKFLWTGVHYILHRLQCVKQKTSISRSSPCFAVDVHVAAGPSYFPTVSTLKQQVCRCRVPSAAASHHRTIHNCVQALVRRTKHGQKKYSCRTCCSLTNEIFSLRDGIMKLEAIYHLLICTPAFFSDGAIC